MTIETPTEPTDEAKQKRRDSLAKARAAKAAKAKEAQESPSRVMSADEVRARKARLIQELADMPSEDIPQGAEPGSLIKDGLGPDKVPWTPAVLRDYCNRGVVVDGVKFEWKSILGDGKIISVAWNGIVYWLWPERENKIPSVHHAVYMQSLEDRRREANRWRSPDSPGVGNLDGYNSAEAHATEIGSPSNLGHIMGVGPLEPRGE